jgi:hypothetical protein
MKLTHIIMRFLFVSVITSLLIFASCCPPFDNSKLLTVPLHPQQTSMWCWAASAQMCMDFQGTNILQCTQTNNRYAMTNCCNSPIPGACVLGGWPEFNKYGFTSKNTVDAALTWDQIRQEIDCRNRPLTYTWHWAGGSGHMVTIVGYSTGTCNDDRFLHINDPLPVNTGSTYTITYEAYVAGNPGSSHWNDYYEIKPAP